MPDGLTQLCGGLLMVGIRGAEPGQPELEEDLERCRLAGVRSVVLFDRDLAAGGAERSRNIVSPAQVKRLTDRVREVLGPGTRIAVDQEGGRVARLNETNGHERGPAAEDFGQLEVERMRTVAASQAEQLVRAGIDWNLAPCVDLRLAGCGSLIEQSGRAFSGEVERVVECAGVIVEEMNRRGIACALKHFPGHGSASGDTHEALLDVTAVHQPDELRVFSAFLKPERSESNFAVMTAHLLHRNVDPQWPVSLSAIWTGVIRGAMGFDGVIITDALDMGAIAGRYDPVEAVVRAAQAGADVLLLANNMPTREARLDPLRAAEAMARAVMLGEIEGGETRIRASHARLDRLCS